MSVLVYIESKNSKPKKNSAEVISYGRALADMLSSELIILSFNIENTNVLSNYGPDKILNIKNDDLIKFNVQKYADVIAQVCGSLSINHIIVGGSADSKYLAPSLSVKTDSSYISNVVGLPTTLDPFKLKRSTYSNKAFSDVIINNSKKLIGIYNNSFGIVEKKSDPELIYLDVKVPDSLLQTDSVEYGSGNISIADADIVVSAGRGLKGPENWNIIEDLAKTLGAATACSKPVSDMGWRPHGEHVGQTGKPVATNLYIAIGISGAIQHLAGVSSSKVKVVINSELNTYQITNASSLVLFESAIAEIETILNKA